MKPKTEGQIACIVGIVLLTIVALKILLWVVLAACGLYLVNRGLALQGKPSLWFYGMRLFSSFK